MCFIIPLKEDLVKPIAVPFSVYENVYKEDSFKINSEFSMVKIMLRMKRF